MVANPDYDFITVVPFVSTKYDGFILKFKPTLVRHVKVFKNVEIRFVHLPPAGVTLWKAVPDRIRKLSPFTVGLATGFCESKTYVLPEI